ncbi:MAG: hypothetical protein COA78_04970 [Blastopirellula sp.]|nr:MAG: hypothetical protein COA78_04970 [Blastopirellula sp.]
MQTETCQEYRISPANRRCCWYVIISGPVLVAISYWITAFVPDQDSFEVVQGCIVASLVSALVAVPLAWRLRVDEQGIAWRFFIYSDLWSWEDFASGRILKYPSYIFYDPNRNWWRRKLRLNSIDIESIHEVMAVINTHYQLPPAPDVPETLSLKYKFYESVVFDSQGIHLLINKKSFEYQWSDVQHILITRMDPLRRDFSSLIVVLLDREIALRMTLNDLGYNTSWSGETHDEVNEYFLANAPESCIKTTIHGQRSTDREHAKRKIEAAIKKRAEFVVMMSVWLIPIAIMLGCMAFINLTEGLPLLTLFVVVAGPLCVYGYRVQSKEIAELEENLNEVIEGEERVE